MSHPSIFILEITALISVDISIFCSSSFSKWSFPCLALIVGVLLLLLLLLLLLCMTQTLATCCNLWDAQECLVSHCHVEARGHCTTWRMAWNILQYSSNTYHNRKCWFSSVSLGACRLLWAVSGNDMMMRNQFCCWKANSASASISTAQFPDASCQQAVKKPLQQMCGRWSPIL